MTRNGVFDSSSPGEEWGGPGEPVHSPSPGGDCGDGSQNPLLGIIIPALNEASGLPMLLTDLSSLPFPFRAVVVDGGSTDGTREAARRCGFRVVLSARGRARQMNVGADLLRTPWLLFLHADVRLTAGAARALASWLRQADPDHVGTFRFGLQGDHWFWRFIEVGQAIRERVFGLAYGDQGLLVSSERFRTVGGYPEIPLMEDVALLRSLRRGGRWKRIGAPLLSSPRRYEEEGRWRGWIRNTILISLYAAGVPPERLAFLYPARDRGSDRRQPPPDPRPPHVPEPRATGRRPPRPPPDTPSVPPSTGTRNQEAESHRPVLMVFAKVPEPGRVKTRLAGEVGDLEAARIYRKLGRQVVDQVRQGRYRTTIFFDPPNGQPAIESWLGSEGLAFRPQQAGDLGSRIAGAFHEVLHHAPKAVVVGTDAPGVDRDLVEEAFRCLDTADLVLGPALDGGYYLLGAKSAPHALFDEIPWSTGRVAEITLARAERLGMRVSILPTLRDVDTLEDLQFAWK